MHTEISSRFAFAQALIREAGALALGYFKRLATLTVTRKGLQDLASEADLETEMLIRNRIAKAYPHDGFLGEETGHAGLAADNAIWVVDPIDGTQPFLSGLSSWCVSIALVVKGQIQFGLVYCPADDELFVGGIGIAATLNGKPIQPMTEDELSDGVISVGYNNRIAPDRILLVFERLLKAGGMYQRNGSGALCLCYVACGRLLGYVEPHINSWDCLGAIAIIHAAGGRTNDFLAGDGLLKGSAIVAGGPAVYDKVAALLSG